ncbi:hypothetical protein NLI96_g8314 [Meripilus lineatus]|uniref:Uncharacterized protein n=1 Tax=Meripilus lineatus TaxID=2056292 RepID=A0AAD5UXT4_9APHY|nr:hypothetical protein NLI96_g8314 [Physisporinus lineatus]
MSSHLLTRVFNPEVADGVAPYIQQFNFSEIDVNDSSKDDHMHLDLAPSFGTLNKNTIRNLDESVKIMIAGTMLRLKEHREKNGPMDWATINSVLMQNSLLVCLGDEVSRSSQLSKDGDDFLKYDGSADKEVVREVPEWFADLVRDQDVLDSTQIDINDIVKILEKVGATATSFDNLFYANESIEKTLIDIAILRFPDISNPYFKFYRIKLVVQAETRRYAFVTSKESRIHGTFNSCSYGPRHEIIEGLSTEARKKALEEAEHLFDD